MGTIYLDHISGTPLHPLVKQEMIGYITEQGFGNPSSQHRFGDAATEALDQARAKTAGLINANPEDIVFTSGGTEANNHAIKGSAFAKAKKGNHIITSNIEHQSVSRPLRTLLNAGYEVTSVSVDRYGLVNPADVEKEIRDKTILITIMHGNNEIGTLEPVEEIGKVAKARGITFHTDAVASCGNVPIDVSRLNIDLLSMAANQFYGPPGVGALYVRPKTEILPLIEGGTQENGRRAGTPNMLGVVGMGKAAELAHLEMPERTAHVLQLKRAFLERLRTIDDIVINPKNAFTLD
jgi:cysteine desulfurase